MKRLLLIALLLPLVAHADKLSLPADTPPAFQGECASCHLAFPPQLMVAEDWKRVMASLGKHYGDNADLDEKTRKSIEDFLVRHAGGAKVGAGGTARQDGDLPRMTKAAWFVRKHREVPAADWTHATVKTPANCTACHTRAAEGSYREREIVLPGNRPWGN